MNSIKKKETRKSKIGSTKTSVANWINYEDKIAVLTPEIPSVNLVNANDMNSIKWTVMQGIPLFYKGQVLMFSYNNTLNEFLAKYNLVVNVDYKILNQDQYTYLRAGYSNIENQIVANQTPLLTQGHFPNVRINLKNNQNNFNGIGMHVGRGGDPNGCFPIVSGFWNYSPTMTTTNYFIDLNSGPQSFIDPKPRSYVFPTITFIRDIFATDLKKGV